MVGLLTAVSEELQDVPLHYTLSDLAGTLHCTCPSMDQFKVRRMWVGGCAVRYLFGTAGGWATTQPTPPPSLPPHALTQAALINAGYRVSNQHKEPTAIKTDAPPGVVWDIMRCWVEKHPVGDRGRKENSPAAKILAQAPVLRANFSIPPQLLGPKKKVKRFPPNPEAFWGPKARARGSNNKRPREGEGGGEGEKQVAEGGEAMKEG